MLNGKKLIFPISPPGRICSTDMVSYPYGWQKSKSEFSFKIDPNAPFLRKIGWKIHFRGQIWRILTQIFEKRIFRFFSSKSHFLSWPIVKALLCDIFSLLYKNVLSVWPRRADIQIAALTKSIAALGGLRPIPLVQLCFLLVQQFVYPPSSPYGYPSLFLLPASFLVENFERKWVEDMPTYLPTHLPISVQVRTGALRGWLKKVDASEYTCTRGYVLLSKHSREKPENLYDRSYRAYLTGLPAGRPHTY